MVVRQGIAKKNSLAVTTSGSFTVVVGAGGAGTRLPMVRTGGTTTVAGTGLSATLTANGGAGGTERWSQASGGTAANGDVNNTGGAGGQNGGGAVGITGTGNAGGAGGRIVHMVVLAMLQAQKASWVTVISVAVRWRCFSTTLALMLLRPTNYSPMETVVFQQEAVLIIQMVSGSQEYCHGGHGGIGGGGGGCANDYSSGYASGGNGGNGIVIIQYLPA